MTHRYVPLLLLLTGLWGSSFLFIEIGLREVEPATLIMLRLLSAALVLLPAMAIAFGVRNGGERLRSAWKPLVVLGTINAAIPFTLIAWGQTHIDSGVAAIANASMPIFVALLAIRFLPSERATGTRVAGIVAGILGVGVLAGANPGGGLPAVAGTLAVVAAAVMYASGALYAQTHVEDTHPLVLATGSTLVGGAVLLPLGLAEAPAQFPGWELWVSVAALGVGGMAAGQFVYYVLLENHGSAKASFVTYLLPVMALLLGVVFLDEPLTISALVGLVLVLLGVALGSGLLRPARRREPAAVHAP